MDCTSGWLCKDPDELQTACSCSKSFHLHMLGVLAALTLLFLNDLKRSVAAKSLKHVVESFALVGITNLLPLATG